jgi:hypothetical protein
MSSRHKDILIDQCEDLCEESYTQGYKNALKDVLDHLRLIGGPEMEVLINSIRYATAKGVALDYPNDPEHYEVVP